MIRNLSQKQLDVMKILWDAGTPLVASDIVKAESSMNINTVQASLRVLLKREPGRNSRYCIQWNGIKPQLPSAHFQRCIFQCGI